MKDFTLVICTFKRHFLIEACLKSVLSGSMIPNKIIIVDQNYDYLTYDKIINLFKNKKFYNYQIIRNLIKKGLTRSKNISLKHINTKYIFFLDDDIILDKKYLSRNIELIFKKKAHAVCGVISNYEKSYYKNFIYLMFNFSIFRDNRYFFINYKKLLTKPTYEIFQVPGGITFYDSRIFKKTSFDDKYITHNYEDVEFNIRLRKLFKKPKLFINLKTLAHDKLSRETKENFNLRIYFMTLLYLKNKGIKNFISYIATLSGYLLSSIPTYKIKYFIDLRKNIKKAISKAKN